MPSYQKALEFAHNKAYEDSVLKLNDTIKEIDKTIGLNTNLHLYIYQRIAGIQQILGDRDAVEETFQKCIETSKNSPFNKVLAKKGTKEAEQQMLSNVFMWQNNLLKFFLEFDVERAIDYGQDVISDVGPKLPSLNQQDLYFSVGTAYSLECEEIDTAIDLYNQALAHSTKGPQDISGIIYNNLGITHFYKFIEAQRVMEDPAAITEEKMKQVVEEMNLSI